LFTVWFDGTYMHYVAIASFEWNQPLYYRRGTPNPDGTITWSAPEQIAVPASATERYLTPCIAVDSDTYPFISYHKAVDTDADGLVDEGYTTVTKSSKNDGTWLTASGFPYTLYYEAVPVLFPHAIIPLTLAKMYVVYVVTVDGFWQLRGREWNSWKWYDEETPSTENISDFSVVAEGDHVGLAYLVDAVWDLKFVKRTYDIGWGSLETIATAQEGVEKKAEATPALTGFNGNYYCFWERDDVIYYKKRINGVWDTTATLWVSEYVYPWSLTSYHRKGDNKIGAIWVWISAEVYYVRHEFIEINLYAHLETVTIADIAYYLLKIISADATGLDLSVDGGTVGRKLFGKFVYPLTTVKKILASTWKVFYRTWTSKRVEWHCDIDILIRKADGTIRTAIASDVANSPLLVGVTTPTTVSGTYTFAEYNVVDQTDYLEIDFYATVEVRAVGQTVYLRIDDKALPIADQVRIEDVAWTEYFVEYPPPPPPVVVPRIVGDTLTWVIG